MRLLALLTALTTISPVAEAKSCSKTPIKIAVLDTGFGWHDKGHGAHLCKFGHKDFSAEGNLSVSYDTRVPVPMDTHGHGTNIVGIIDGYVSKSKVDYCIVVVKYYSSKQSGNENLEASVKALNYAANLKVDYINYSGGGVEFSGEEYKSVKRFLDQGGRFIAAAGNENSNLDLSSYYPAMYDSRIIIVGNLTAHGVRSVLSNYGSVVKRWEVGEDIEAYRIVLSGTSQATAVATGKIVSESKCDTRR